MFELKKSYELLKNTLCRYVIITGGRGSGKSYNVCVYLIGLTFQRHQVILFTRYTMKSAHISIIPEFLNKIEKYHLNKFFHVTKDEIVNKLTGSRIMFRGLLASSGDQTANLKSIEGVTVWVLDEAEESKSEDKFDDIDLSVRSDLMPNKVIMILNPTTKEHFIYKKFFLNNGWNSGDVGEKGMVAYIHTTYLDNLKHLSKSFIEKANELKETNYAKYKEKFLGVWRDKAEGVIYNYEFGEFKDPLKVVRYGMDFGYNDPTTCVAVAVDRDTRTAYLKEVFYKNKTLVEDVWVQIREEVNGAMIIADSAKKDDIERLRWLGANIYPCYKGGGIDGSSIMPGIKSVKKWKLVVDPNSINLIKELNEYCFDTRKSDYPIDKWNHALDAVRYVLYDLEISGIC